MNSKSLEAKQLESPSCSTATRLVYYDPSVCVAENAGMSRIDYCANDRWTVPNGLGIGKEDYFMVPKALAAKFQASKDKERLGLRNSCDKK
jgi:hypothetical protein